MLYITNDSQRRLIEWYRRYIPYSKIYTTLDTSTINPDVALRNNVARISHNHTRQLVHGNKANIPLDEHGTLARHICITAFSTIERTCRWSVEQGRPSACGSLGHRPCFNWSLPRDQHESTRSNTTNQQFHQSTPKCSSAGRLCDPWAVG